MQQKVKTFAVDYQNEADCSKQCEDDILCPSSHISMRANLVSGGRIRFRLFFWHCLREVGTNIRGTTDNYNYQFLGLLNFKPKRIK
jgi:hypothetical protein